MVILYKLPIKYSYFTIESAEPILLVTEYTGCIFPFVETFSVINFPFLT